MAKKSSEYLSVRLGRPTKRALEAIVKRLREKSVSVHVRNMILREIEDESLRKRTVMTTAGSTSDALRTD